MYNRFVGDLCLSSPSADISAPHWKPLLLIVPLRLGLSQMNSIYLGGLKVNNRSLFPITFQGLLLNFRNVFNSNKV